MVKRKANKTVLIVAEGFCDKAFVDYLKRLYVVRGCGISVKVKNANGKGSNHVVQHAIRIREGYDIKVAFYDSDVVLRLGLRKEARVNKIRLIESSPCLEGLLLSILDCHVPHQSSECKQLITEKLEGKDPTIAESYLIISRQTLDVKRNRISELDELLKALEGK